MIFISTNKLVQKLQREESFHSPLFLNSSFCYRSFICEAQSYQFRASNSFFLSLLYDFVGVRNRQSINLGKIPFDISVDFTTMILFLFMHSLLAFSFANTFSVGSFLQLLSVPSSLSKKSPFTSYSLLNPIYYFRSILHYLII